MEVAVGALRLAERDLHVYAESCHQMLNLAQEGAAALIYETEGVMVVVGRLFRDRRVRVRLRREPTSPNCHAA